MSIEHYVCEHNQAIQSHVTHTGMHWQNMVEQIVAIQDAAEESDCDDCDESISDRPSASQTSGTMYESDSCK